MRPKTADLMTWGCLSAMLLATLGFFGLQFYIGQKFSAPFLFVWHSPGESRHEALFLLQGFQDRGWTLFVKPDGKGKPIRVAPLDLGVSNGYHFAEADWSKDGQVMVATIRVGPQDDNVRALGYDFAARQSLVAPGEKWREYEPTVLALIAEHGGFAGHPENREQMMRGGRKIWIWSVPR